MVSDAGGRARPGGAAAAAPSPRGLDQRDDPIVIIGAGPTGLGAATRLEQHGHDDWCLLEQAESAGGLACTAVTPEGFLFDMGGHVIFSHWDYFDQLLDEALGSGPESWNTLQRVSYVWIRQRFVAYPFQNNIAALPKDDQVTCLTGLVEAKLQNALSRTKPANFDEWILRVMGPGIADLFMRPYNFKVWAVPPATMQCGWLGERVATVDVARAIGNVIHGREDAGWGPNAVFRFPTRGGTGAIWSAVAGLLPRHKQRYGQRVVGIDGARREVTLASGERLRYRALISTLPLDSMLRMLGRHEWADGLHHSSSHIIGVGVRGASPHGSKCWLYYPEADCPFYRCTVFSNYAAANCPPPSARLPTLCLGDGSPVPEEQQEAADGPYWSLMFEVSESADHKPVSQQPVQLGAAGAWPEVVLETLQGAVATQLLQAGDQVVSLFHRRLEHGYPTPSLGRDAVLDAALPWLQQEAGIWSRGRFGSYKYEVGNQDHSLMLGVEATDNVLFGAREVTLHHPDIANARKNAAPRYSPCRGGGGGAGGGAVLQANGKHH